MSPPPSALDFVVPPQEHSLAVSDARDFSISGHLEYIHALVRKGGPEPVDFCELDLWHASTRQLVANACIRGADLPEIRAQFGDAMSTGTLQGWVVARPRGYLGDFELMDRIYTNAVSPDPRLARWDRYFQSQPMPRAVRERLEFLHDTVRSHPRYLAGEKLNVLVAGVGPGRDIHAFLLRDPFCRVCFRCIDFDPEAIGHARQLNHAFPDHVAFQNEALQSAGIRRNLDLIWAPGIFDYCDDRAFKLVLRAFVTAADAGGSIVIAGLSETAPGRAYLDFCGWDIEARSRETMERLARESGISDRGGQARCLSKGANHFLTIQL